MQNEVASLNLTADEKIRVYADLSKDAYLKLKLRCAQVGIEKGRAISRKQYLEYLIEQDILRVQGASVRLIEHKMAGTATTRRKDQK